LSKKDRWNLTIEYNFKTWYTFRDQNEDLLFSNFNLTISHQYFYLLFNLLLNLCQYIFNFSQKWYLWFFFFNYYYYLLLWYDVHAFKCIAHTYSIL